MGRTVLMLRVYSLCEAAADFLFHLAAKDVWRAMRKANLQFILCGGLMATLMWTSARSAAAQQTSKAPMQPLYLPDPTPRPPDLQREYDNHPSDKEAKQRAAMLLSAQRRELIVRATNELVILAQQLKTGVASSAPGVSLAPHAQTAGAIEGLAKNVKEAIKAQ